MYLKSSRYEEIKKSVSELIEDYNVTTLPIDVFELAKAMKIDVKFRSDIPENIHNDLNYMSYSNQTPAAVIYNEKQNKLVTLIDDLSNSFNKQRFSLAHEIAHICLSHIEQSDKNEYEADYFAHELLIPTSLLCDMEENLVSHSILSYIFAVSEETADIAIRYRNNRKTISQTFQYEEVIKGHLRDSLIENLKEIKKGC